MRGDLRAGAACLGFHRRGYVRNIAIESSSLVLDVTSRLLSLPLRELLALELSRALNEVISDLPNQVPTLKKVEIIDIQN